MQTALFILVDTPPQKIQHEAEVLEMNMLLCALNVAALATLATLHFSGTDDRSEQVIVQSQPHLTQPATRLALRTAPASTLLANDSEKTTPGTTQRWVF